MKKAIIRYEISHSQHHAKVRSQIMDSYLSNNDDLVAYCFTDNHDKRSKMDASKNLRLVYINAKGKLVASTVKHQNNQHYKIYFILNVFWLSPKIGE